MRKNFNATKYNQKMDKLFNSAMKAKKKWDTIRKLEIDYMLAEEKSEKQALKLSIFNLKRVI